MYFSSSWSGVGWWHQSDVNVVWTSSPGSGTEGKDCRHPLHLVENLIYKVNNVSLSLVLLKNVFVNKRRNHNCMEQRCVQKVTVFSYHIYFSVQADLVTFGHILVHNYVVQHVCITDCILSSICSVSV